MISTTNRSNWSETFTLFNPLSFENETFTFFSYCFSVQDAYWQHLKIDVLFTKLENLYEKVDPESENRHTMSEGCITCMGRKLILFTEKFDSRRFKIGVIDLAIHLHFPNWVNSSSYKIWSLHFLKSRWATHDVALFVM